MNPLMNWDTAKLVVETHQHRLRQLAQVDDSFDDGQGATHRNQSVLLTKLATNLIGFLRCYDTGSATAGIIPLVLR